jgi:hypothetical protein
VPPCCLAHPHPPGPRTAAVMRRSPPAPPASPSATARRPPHATRSCATHLQGVHRDRPGHGHGARPGPAGLPPTFHAHHSPRVWPLRPAQHPALAAPARGVTDGGGWVWGSCSAADLCACALVVRGEKALDGVRQPARPPLL